MAPHPPVVERVGGLRQVFDLLFAGVHGSLVDEYRKRRKIHHPCHSALPASFSASASSSGATAVTTASAQDASSSPAAIRATLPCFSKCSMIGRVDACHSEKAVEGQAKEVEGQGKAVEDQGEAVENQGKAVEDQGKAIEDQ